MLNFDDLKDKLTESFNTAKDAIEESSAYNSLREKYETLPATTQKWILIGSIIVGVFLIMSIPYSFVSSSSNFVAEFEEHRDLIRSLLRTRNLSGGPPLPRGMTAEDMKMRVESSLDQAGLLDTQLGSIEILSDGDPNSKLAPANVTQQGVKVELKKLNLRQILDLGYRLQNLDGSVKMTGLEIKAAADDPHYFNTIFKLISYSLPETVEKSEKEDSGRSRRNRGS